MSDIVEALREDHRSIERLLHRFESVGSEDRSEWFDQLRQVIVRHEGAEERTVYPAVRHAVADEDIASHDRALDDLLTEQAEAHDLIAGLETVKSETEAFRKGFLRLRRAVVDHIEEEERSLIPFIEENKSPEERRELGRHYERAKHGARRATPQATR